MRSPGSFWLAALAVVTGAGFGCGRSAEERQLDAMREEIVRVRENRDRADQMPGTADPTPSAHESAGPPLVVPEAYGSGPPVRPPPPVVQLGQDGQGGADDSAEADPQDTTPRPTIRVFGSVRGGGRNARSDDQVEETTPDDRAGPSGSTALDPDAKRAYDAALSLVNAKRFDQALDALAAFLVKWPDHPYADNAMYWRGECYFARGDFVHAAEQFEGVLTRFPVSEKAPDALLKLGLSHDKLGHAAKARECFDRLARQYPESDAARRAPALRAPTTPPGPAPEEHR
jgi:tol-pal system protein YbgF